LPCVPRLRGQEAMRSINTSNDRADLDRALQRASSYPPETSLAERTATTALSVVVPVRNEAQNVAPLFYEIRAALHGIATYEVIFVDDGSDDGTVERLRTMVRQHPGVLRAVRHPSNCGQSTAVHTGVRMARHPWIATLDGDGQNDPRDIPRLLEAMRQSNGSVQLFCGYRRNRRDTWIKRLSSRIANGVRGRLLHDRTPDTGCGLKLFARETFLALPYFDHMH